MRRRLQFEIKMVTKRELSEALINLIRSGLVDHLNDCIIVHEAGASTGSPRMRQGQSHDYANAVAQLTIIVRISPAPRAEVRRPIFNF